MVRPVVVRGSGVRRRHYSLDADPVNTQTTSNAAFVDERTRQLFSWWRQARTLQSDVRLEQAVDDDSVDGIQWTEEEKEILLERGQQPLVFNEIQNSLLGGKWCDTAPVNQSRCQAHRRGAGWFRGKAFRRR